MEVATGTWFYPSAVDWLGVDLNASLQSFVRKRLVLSGLNYWRSMECITREKSVVSERSLLFHREIKI